jgi:Zn-dependent metalloprotease
MVFGDGDGMLFSDFTGSLDVIGHELTHGVTETSAGLVYHRQSGALNESVSDVFGSLVKQWSLNQSAEDADWLIGADIFTPAIAGDALRSLKNPGSAYDNDIFGKDPQPDHMSRYDDLPDTEEGDFGGVHINSGIPNKAFYLVATEIGGYAWEAPGHIWYESLKASSPTTDFRGFAELTFMMADRLYGAGSREQQAVAAAWQEVGVRVPPVVARMETPPRARRGNGQAQREEDSLAALSRQVAALAEQVSALSREVNSAKSRRVSTRN